MSDERERPEKAPSGPVPVRDLMKPAAPDIEAEGEPRWEGHDRHFEHVGVEWTARPAGAGAYGTGRRGKARLLAVHFYRDDEPDRPVREALVPAGIFPNLGPEELRDLFEGATPIELDNDQRRGGEG